ncbi:MAG: prephenate dehydrogenase [Micrococcaceae bacterium]
MPTVLIIGAGVLGTSMAIGLKTAGYEVFLHDTNRSVLQKAAKISGASTKECNPDLVIVATPPASTADLAQQALKKYPQAIVADIASTKSLIAAEVNNERFIPTHPMAGSEKTGPIHAHGSLFHGANWVVCRRNKSIEDMVKALGATPIFLNPQQHDEAVALVSHLPQLFASILAAQLVGKPEEYVQLAGQGLRDTTRIAASNPKLWQQIIASNQQALEPLMKETYQQFQQLDLNKTQDLIAQGNEGHRAIPVKRAHKTGEYMTASIAIDDKPGQWAALLNTVAAANINVEDMRMEHAPQQRIGVVKLLLAADKVETLHKVVEPQWEILDVEEE